MQTWSVPSRLISRKKNLFEENNHHLKSSKILRLYARQLCHLNPPYLLRGLYMFFPTANSEKGQSKWFYLWYNGLEVWLIISFSFYTLNLHNWRAEFNLNQGESVYSCMYPLFRPLPFRQLRCERMTEKKVKHDYHIQWDGVLQFAYLSLCC
jgi:hypothetical protein